MTQRNDPLKPILESYEAAIASIDVTKKILALKKVSNLPETIEPVLVGGLRNLSTDNFENIFAQAPKEVNDLFVVSIWAIFERWLRDYLQAKNYLHEITAINCSLHQNLAKQIEYLRADELLDLIEQGFYQPKSDFIKNARGIIKYRNWVAHGKKADKVPRSVEPNDAYSILNSIIKHIQHVEPLETLSELKEHSQKIYCLIKLIKQDYFNDQRLEALETLEQKIALVSIELQQHVPDKDKLLNYLTEMESTIGNSLESFISVVRGLEQKNKKSAKKSLAALREEIRSAMKVTQELTINQ